MSRVTGWRAIEPLPGAGAGGAAERAGAGHGLGEPCAASHLHGQPEAHWHDVQSEGPAFPPLFLFLCMEYWFEGGTRFWGLLQRIQFVFFDLFGVCVCVVCPVSCFCGPFVCLKDCHVGCFASSNAYR